MKEKILNKVFLDSSSLVKIYHFEKDSDKIDKILENSSMLFLSSITKIEFMSAIFKKVKTKEIDLNKAKEIIFHFTNDYLFIEFLNFINEIENIATELIKKYSLIGLRTLDSIQIATIIYHQDKFDFAISSDNIFNKILELENIKSISIND